MSRRSLRAGCGTGNYYAKKTSCLDSSPLSASIRGRRVNGSGLRSDSAAAGRQHARLFRHLHERNEEQGDLRVAPGYRDRDAVAGRARRRDRESEFSRRSIRRGNSSTPSTRSNTFGGQTTGAVSAFAIDRRPGLLKPLNEQSSEGTGPAHLTVDRDGKNVLVANYGGGSVAVLPIARDGTLKSGSSVVQHTGSSVNRSGRRHRTRIRSRRILQADSSTSADLGLDWILIYQFDERKGLLKLNDPPNVKVTPGSRTAALLGASERPLWLRHQ